MFTFIGDTLLGYHIAYVDELVRQCGSGQSVPLSGNGKLEVRLTPARAHTDTDRRTVADRKRAPRLPLLLERTCDFEGCVTWVLGLTAPNRYRGPRLRRPARLVVDVRHDA